MRTVRPAIEKWLISFGQWIISIIKTFDSVFLVIVLQIGISFYTNKKLQLCFDLSEKCNGNLGSRLANDGSIRLVVDHCL